MTDREENMLRLVRQALAEDVGRGDVTSLACLEPRPSSAQIIAKSAGILSGIRPASLAFTVLDSSTEVLEVACDGDRFKRGQVIADIRGENRSVLSAERVALNFLGHLSGVATLTNRFVQEIIRTDCRILDTRKTTPGLRSLEKEAVFHGGGGNHRMGLYDMVLIKDNHIAAAGSIGAAVERMRRYLGSADFAARFAEVPHPIKVEVEVTSEAEVRAAIEAGADRLLLDNQSVESLARLVALARSLNSEVQLEASGNVNLDNVVAVADTGVDFISIGALTHSARASDFSLRIVT